MDNAAIIQNVTVIVAALISATTIINTTREIHRNKVLKRQLRKACNDLRIFRKLEKAYVSELLRTSEFKGRTEQSIINSIRKKNELRPSPFSYPSNLENNLSNVDL